jgi:hypothetical protein
LGNHKTIKGGDNWYFQWGWCFRREQPKEHFIIRGVKAKKWRPLLTVIFNIELIIPLFCSFHFTWFCTHTINCIHWLPNFNLSNLQFSVVITSKTFFFNGILAVKSTSYINLISSLTMCKHLYYFQQYFKLLVNLPKYCFDNKCKVYHLYFSFKSCIHYAFVVLDLQALPQVLLLSFFKILILIVSYLALLLYGLWFSIICHITRLLQPQLFNLNSIQFPSSYP